MAIPPPRIEVTEFIPSPEVLPRLQEAGYDLDHAIAVLTRLAGTLRRHFKLEEDETPIALVPDGVKIMNLAGVLRLAPGVDIDLAPKFLGHTYEGWREDWLAIANLTGHGRILSSHLVIGTYGQSSDLASLIGRTFVAEFMASERRPLRIYQRRSWTEWVIDGELDVEHLITPGLDGLPQTAVALDRVNLFNAMIRAAAGALLREVRDPVVRNQIARIHEAIPPQGRPPMRPPRIPSRHRRWAPLLELSRQILDGFDVTLRHPPGTDDAQAPGLIVRTWQAWERLTFVALRRTWGDERVHAQQQHPWAVRGTQALTVRPDISVAGAPVTAPLDAKYKTRLDRGRRAIAQTDLTEASAFMDACGSDSIVLLYPRLAERGSGPTPCGSCFEFDRVQIGPKTVIGVEVEVRGIGTQGGYKAFSETLATELAALHPALAAQQAFLAAAAKGAAASSAGAGVP